MAKPPVRTRRELDHLLAQGRVAAPRREEILDHVLSQAAPKAAREPRRLWRWAAVATPLAASAAALLVWGAPSPRAEPYAAKGSGGSRVELLCAGGSLASCAIGSRLLFRVDGMPAPAWVHAYAEPLDAAAERVWYFPTSNAPPAQLSAGTPGELLGKAVEIGEEHAPGRYAVHVVVGTRPLTRAEVLRAASSGGADAAVAHVAKVALQVLR